MASHISETGKARILLRAQVKGEEKPAPEMNKEASRINILKTQF